MGRFILWGAISAAHAAWLEVLYCGMPSHFHSDKPFDKGLEAVRLPTELIG
jgi:hypothetical protein